ncbi:MAG: hypothetical protein ACTHJ7_07720, partial [Candidatus Nitrosocosmicus sp.]
CNKINYLQRLNYRIKIKKSSHFLECSRFQTLRGRRGDGYGYSIGFKIMSTDFYHYELFGLTKLKKNTNKNPIVVFYFKK